MNHSKRKNLNTVARQRGLTLIELMVAMVIGLVVTLAVTGIVIVGESHKRTTTSNNDTSQSGAFAAYSIDRLVRSAGSGFVQTWNLGGFGCRLSVSRDIDGTATAILPRGASFPAPFAGFLGGGAAAGTLRMAPVLIGKGQSASGSDVLMVMGGNGAAGDVPRRVLSPGVLAPGSLRLDNKIGLGAGDIGLLTQSGSADCLVEQVAAVAAFNAAVVDELPLAGFYYNATAPYSTLRASDPTNPTYYTTLGNIAANNVQFQLLGVGANRTLFSYDLLRAAGTGSDADTPPQALAEGVAELHAMYGLDTNRDGVVETWVGPDAAGYDIATLMATPDSVRNIAAIRVALVLRSSLYDKNEVALTRPMLFAGTAGEIAAANLTGDDRHFRLRVIDTTIPLRNMLLLPTL